MTDNVALRSCVHGPARLVNFQRGRCAAVFTLSALTIGGSYTFIVGTFCTWILLMVVLSEYKTFED